MRIGDWSSDVGSFDLMADPAFGDAEEADRLEVRLRTHVEPVRDVRRQVDQIALGADREKHLAVGANIERALAVDEEASLEVGVRVLREELAARGLGLWTVRLDADDVDADEAVTRVERDDFVLISGDHFILAGIRRERLIRSEENKSELTSLKRKSYDGLCLKNKRTTKQDT